MGNDRVKMAERASARAAEQVFRTRELIPSGSVADSESRVPETFPPSRCKRQHSGVIGYDWEGWVQRVRGVGDTRF